MICYLKFYSKTDRSNFIKKFEAGEVLPGQSQNPLKTPCKEREENGQIYAIYSFPLNYEEFGQLLLRRDLFCYYRICGVSVYYDPFNAR